MLESFIQSNLYRSLWRLSMGNIYLYITIYISLMDIIAQYISKTIYPLSSCWLYTVNNIYSVVFNPFHCAKRLTTTVIPSISANGLDALSISVRPVSNRGLQTGTNMQWVLLFRLSRKLDISSLVLPLTSNNYRRAVLLSPLTLFTSIF